MIQLMSTKTKEETMVSPAAGPDGMFTERIGNTTFEIAVFFNKRSTLTAEDHVKRMIRNKVEAGAF